MHQKFHRAKVFDTTKVSPGFAENSKNQAKARAEALLKISDDFILITVSNSDSVLFASNIHGNNFNLLLDSLPAIHSKLIDGYKKIL